MDKHTKKDRIIRIDDKIYEIYKLHKIKPVGIELINIADQIKQVTEQTC